MFEEDETPKKERTKNRLAEVFLRVNNVVVSGGQTTKFGLGTSGSVRKKNMGWILQR